MRLNSKVSHVAIINIITYISFSFIYLDTLVIRDVLDFDIYFYYIVFPILLLLSAIQFNQLLLNRKQTCAFFVFISISILVVTIKGFSLQYPLKQFVIIWFLFLYFYWIARVNSFDLIKLFKFYVNISIVVAVIGIIEISFFWIGFSELLLPYDIVITHRLKSVTSEPSTIAYLFIPVVFFAVQSIIKKEYVYLSRLNSFVIIIAYLLTFSSIAYLGLIIAIYYNLKDLSFKRKIAYSAIFILLIVFIISIPDIRMRALDTFTAFFVYFDIDNVNISTLTLFINFKIAFEIFKDNLILGSGIGTYGVNYDIYFSKLFNVDPSAIIQFNKEDANSLFLRLLAETGLVGLVSFFMFLFKFYTRYSLNDRFNFFHTLNTGIFILILLRLLRFGNYFALGFPFFIIVYIFTYKLSKNS